VAITPRRSEAGPIRKLLITGLRLAVTAGLIALLALRLDLGTAAGLMHHASPELLAATFAILVVGNLCVGLRWHLILSAATLSPGPAALAKLVFVGSFFNQVLPTGVGGDVVRAWRCRKLGIGLGPAIRSILLDRAWGYGVLVMIYAAALPSLLRVLPDPRERAAVVIVLAGAVTALVALLSLDRLPRPLLRLRLVAPFVELSREARSLWRQPARCGAVLAMSMLTIGLPIVACKLIGDGIGSPLSLVVWAMVFAPVTLIQLLPVSLAGWGVREMALVVALGAFGVPAEAALAISILMGLFTLVIGLPGGLIWLSGWDIREKAVSQA
jgi:glycosyltransferase 2 family protein